MDCAQVELCQLMRNDNVSYYMNIIPTIKCCRLADGQCSVLTLNHFMMGCETSTSVPFQVNAAGRRHRDTSWLSMVNYSTLTWVTGLGIGYLCDVWPQTYGFYPHQKQKVSAILSVKWCHISTLNDPGCVDDWSINSIRQLINYCLRVYFHA